MKQWNIFVIISVRTIRLSLVGETAGYLNENKRMCTFYTKVLSSALTFAAMCFKTIALVFCILSISGIAKAQQLINTKSPGGSIQLNVRHNTDGSLHYRVLFKDKTVISFSGLGMHLVSPAAKLTLFDLK